LALCPQDLSFDIVLGKHLIDALINGKGLKNISGYLLTRQVAKQKFKTLFATYFHETRLVLMDREDTMGIGSSIREIGFREVNSAFSPSFTKVGKKSTNS
jgi:hypothetical protein